MAELICERYIFKYNCNTYKTYLLMVCINHIITVTYVY